MPGTQSGNSPATSLRIANGSSFSASAGSDQAGSCLAKTRLTRRRFTPAAAAVPISFDAMASCRITMHRCNKPEKAAVGAVSEQMATYFDGVTSLEVFALDADPLESSMACSFHRPERWHAFLILDLDVKPRM